MPSLRFRSRRACLLHLRQRAWRRVHRFAVQVFRLWSRRAGAVHRPVQWQCVEFAFDAERCRSRIEAQGDGPMPQPERQALSVRGARRILQLVRSTVIAGDLEIEPSVVFDHGAESRLTRSTSRTPRAAWRDSRCASRHASSRLRRQHIRMGVGVHFVPSPGRFRADSRARPA